MNFILRELSAETIEDILKIDGAFVFDSKLMFHFDNNELGYTAVSVPPKTKQYQSEKVNLQEYLINPEKAIYLAYANGRPVGHIILHKSWNNYACIDYIIVDKDYRQHAIGQALMNRAKAWAVEKGLPGLMLETQDNNLQACRFYEKCGFQLGGFDKYLYKGLDPATDETAVYWYFFLTSNADTSTNAHNRQE